MATGTHSSLEKLRLILGDDAPIDAITPASMPKVASEEDLLTDDQVENQYMESLRSIDMKLADEKYYNSQVRKFLKVKKNIKSSKGLVEELIGYLGNFENNLSNLSAQMNNLKNQSEKLDNQLSANSQFEKTLVPIVTDLIISPDIINSILKDPVNVAWCDNLSYLNLKLELHHRYQKDILEYNKSSKADDKSIDPRSLTKFLDEMKHLLDLCILKSVEKIKDFLVNKLKLIRYSKNFTLQVLQKNLLKSKEIFQFLLTHNEPLAVDLRQAYILTVRWYYYKNFGKYLYSLEKLKIYNIDKGYLLGNSSMEASDSGDSTETSSAKFTKSTSWLSPFTSSTTKSAMNAKRPATVAYSNYFSVEDRLNILTDDDPTVLPAQIAETNPLTYWLETPYRSFNLAIIDNGTVEYLFLSEFFQITNQDELPKVFQEIFQGIFQIGINFTKTYLTNNTNYDLYSILICIKLTKIFLFKLQHRKIPVMENYFNLQLITLWPKYQLIVDANCENIKKALIKNSSNSYFSSLTGPSSESNMFEAFASGQSTIVHPVTQQFATLLTSLLKIAAIDTSNPSLISDLTNSFSRAATPSSGEYKISKSHQKGASESSETSGAASLNTSSKPEVPETEPLSTSIVRLRNEYENVLNKLSAHVAPKEVTSKKRERFLYNNYYVLFNVTSQADGNIACAEKEHYQLLMEAYKQSLV
ncbi:Vps52 protein [Saccharomycopsis crataegensis]|uniref:Vps52 protein n=1 Tax=Saccharomycopsis crataegensis TaxID=43959 RepID=A0AAV5QXH6_9ASCO|nr:Vps52 protein [Saccharomycopsis crataegensis]